MAKAAAQLKKPKKRVAKDTSSKKRRKKAKPSEKVKAAAEDTEDVIVNDLGPLMEAVGGDEDLALFFLAWLKHNRVAWKAYKEIRPKVTNGTARVMGAQYITRINKRAIIESYDGLGLGSYLKQLKDGLTATKKEILVIGSGDEKETLIEDVPDHKTRRAYHRALGEILEMENVPTITVQQNNLQQNNVAALSNDELDGYLNR